MSSRQRGCDHSLSLSAGRHRVLPGGRPFDAFLASQALSALADNLLKTAVAVWLAFGEPVGGLSGGVLVAAANALFVLPFVVLSPLAGEFADRLDRAVLMVRVRRVALVAFAIGGVGLGLGSVVGALGGVLCVGAASAAFGGVKYAIVPDLVAREDLVAANALVESSTFLAILLGTIGGGALVGLPGVGPTVAATAAWAVAAVAWAAARGLLRARATEPAGANDGAPTRAPRTLGRASPLPRHVSVIGSMRSAWRLVEGNPRRRALVLASAWFWGVGSAVLTLVPVAVREVWRGDEAVATACFAVFCLGIGLGSAACARWPRAGVERAAQGGALGLASLPVLIASLGVASRGAAGGLLPDVAGKGVSLATLLAMPSGVALLGALGLLALCGGLYAVPLLAALQEEAPEAERARVLGAYNLASSVAMVAVSIAIGALQAAGGSATLGFALTGLASVPACWLLWIRRPLST